MSANHELIKNDPRWKAARTACLEEAGHACEWPGCTETEGLQVDHKVPLDQDLSLAFEPENLWALCHPHHVEKARQNLTLTRNTWINPRYEMLFELTESVF